MKKIVLLKFVRIALRGKVGLNAGVSNIKSKLSMTFQTFYKG